MLPHCEHDGGWFYDYFYDTQLISLAVHPSEKPQGSSNQLSSKDEADRTVIEDKTSL